MASAALPIVGRNSQHPASRFPGGRTARARKPRKSAIFPNWHGPCNGVHIGGSPAGRTRGNTNRTTFSNFSQRAIAGIGAIAISALLFANALATQAAEVQSVAAIFA
jgi:hypothetical protein